MKKLFLLFLVIFFASITTVYAQQQQSQQIWQTKGSVFLRQDPSATSPQVGVLKQGVIVTQIEEDASMRWVKVKSPSGQEGWIIKSMLYKPDPQGCSGVKGVSALCPADPQKKIVPASSVDTNQKGAVLPGGLPQNPVGKPAEEVVMAQVPNLPPIPNTETAEQITKRVDPSKLVSLSSDSLPTSLEGEFQIPGKSYIVSPDAVTAVKMSASDVNRITCPVDITDVVYSEEKGVQIKAVGKNAFVKFLVRKLGSKEVYSSTPADLYIVCGDKVYSIIAFPLKIPSVTVYLEDKGDKIKQVVEKYQGMPFEKKVLELVKAFFTDQVPPEAQVSTIKKEYKIIPNLLITEQAQYLIEGEGLMIRVFKVTNTVNDSLKIPYVDVTEKDFLKKELTKNVVAVSLDKLRLYRADSARLIIVEKYRE